MGHLYDRLVLAFQKLQSDVVNGENLKALRRLNHQLKLCHHRDHRYHHLVHQLAQIFHVELKHNHRHHRQQKHAT